MYDYYYNQLAIIESTLYLNVFIEKPFLDNFFCVECQKGITLIQQITKKKKKKQVQNYLFRLITFDFLFNI